MFLPMSKGWDNNSIYQSVFKQNALRLSQVKISLKAHLRSFTKAKPNLISQLLIFQIEKFEWSVT